MSAVNRSHLTLHLQVDGSPRHARGLRLGSVWSASFLRQYAETLALIFALCSSDKVLPFQGGRPPPLLCALQGEELSAVWW